MGKDYIELRSFQGERLEFIYDTGAKIVGKLKKCLPEEGAVQLALMSDVEIIASDGKILEHHPIFSFVPNQQVRFSKVK